MESEGRRRPRYPFIAVAQVTESQSSAVLEARTSDLGDNGCYVDALNPLPQDTVISIQITHQDQVFVARGLVAHVRANMGMGVTFIALESGCATLLETWLREAAGVSSF